MPGRQEALAARKGLRPHPAAGWRKAGSNARIAMTAAGGIHDRFPLSRAGALTLDWEGGVALAPS